MLAPFSNEEQLENVLSRPYDEDVEFARKLVGDILLLGAGGKMGPTLARRIARSLKVAGNNRRVYAVSRSFGPRVQASLRADGVTTVTADLLKPGSLAQLPDCSYLIHMVGKKFGSSARADLTWITNGYLAGQVAERFAGSRIVVFSTGNVYGMVPVQSGGSSESDSLRPVGEYAQSCVARERIFEYFSVTRGTPICIVRINYATEIRYGILVDIATSVYASRPIPLAMGHFNTIWQGDANSVCYRSLSLCKSPPDVLNVTGGELLSVQKVAEEFARRFGRKAIFEGHESDTALLSNARRCFDSFGPPHVPLRDMLDAIAAWIETGAPTLNKPTGFQITNGVF